MFGFHTFIFPRCFFKVKAGSVEEHKLIDFAISAKCTEIALKYEPVHFFLLIWKMSNLISKTVDNIAADIAAGKVTGPACGPEYQLAVRKQIAKTEKNCQNIFHGYFNIISSLKAQGCVN